ncbi:hypothetical protein BJV74DRAFT_795332 [Russula compacta]|nr:hypothetical protein BJV74DRAFT_795332 [Russula compacta]
MNTNTDFAVGYIMPPVRVAQTIQQRGTHLHQRRGCPAPRATSSRSGRSDRTAATTHHAAIRLTQADIAECMELYATAACEAIEHTQRYSAARMGVDQFFKESSKQSPDKYGSPEDRARFARVRGWWCPCLWPLAGEECSIFACPRGFGNQLCCANPAERTSANSAKLRIIEPRVRRGMLYSTAPSRGTCFMLLRPANLWISIGRFVRESAIKRADERGELIAVGWYSMVVVQYIRRRETFH